MAARQHAVVGGDTRKRSRRSGMERTTCPGRFAARARACEAVRERDSAIMARGDSISRRRARASRQRNAMGFGRAAERARVAARGRACHVRSLPRAVRELCESCARAVRGLYEGCARSRDRPRRQRARRSARARLPSPWGRATRPAPRFGLARPHRRAAAAGVAVATAGVAARRSGSRRGARARVSRFGEARVDRVRRARETRPHRRSRRSTTYNTVGHGSRAPGPRHAAPRAIRSAADWIRATAAISLALHSVSLCQCTRPALRPTRSCVDAIVQHKAALPRSPSRPPSLAACPSMSPHRHSAASHHRVVQSRSTVVGRDCISTVRSGDQRNTSTHDLSTRTRNWR